MPIRTGLLDRMAVKGKQYSGHRHKRHMGHKKEIKTVTSIFESSEVHTAWGQKPTPLFFQL